MLSAIEEGLGMCREYMEGNLEIPTEWVLRLELGIFSNPVRKIGCIYTDAIVEFCDVSPFREKAEQTIWNRLRHLTALKSKRPPSQAPLRIGILGKGVRVVVPPHTSYTTGSRTPQG